MRSQVTPLQDAKHLDAVKRGDTDTTQPQAGLETASPESVEPKPIGTNKWGNVYQWTLGKAKEAARFLKAKGSGYLKGVFHNDELGDIDLIWGNEKAVLQKIEQKHSVELNDFENLEQAITVIEDVINKGGIRIEGSRAVIEKDNYRVILDKTPDGTWVLSAYDYTKTEQDKKRSPLDSESSNGQNTDNGSSPMYNDGQTSDSKDTTKVSETQAEEEKQSYKLGRVIKPANNKADALFNKYTIAEDGKATKQELDKIASESGVDFEKEIAGREHGIEKLKVQ